MSSLRQFLKTKFPSCARKNKLFKNFDFMQYGTNLYRPVEVIETQQQHLV